MRHDLNAAGLKCLQRDTAGEFDLGQMVATLKAKITEAENKAVARALRQAVEPDPRVAGVPSTKRSL